MKIVASGLALIFIIMMFVFSANELIIFAQDDEIDENFGNAGEAIISSRWRFSVYGHHPPHILLSLITRPNGKNALRLFTDSTPPNHSLLLFDIYAPANSPPQKPLTITVDSDLSALNGGAFGIIFLADNETYDLIQLQRDADNLTLSGWTCPHLPAEQDAFDTVCTQVDNTSPIPLLASQQHIMLTVMYRPRLRLSTVNISSDATNLDTVYLLISEQSDPDGIQNPLLKTAEVGLYVTGNNAVAQINEVAITGSNFDQVEIPSPQDFDDQGGIFVEQMQYGILLLRLQMLASLLHPAEENSDLCPTVRKLVNEINGSLGPFWLHKDGPGKPISDEVSYLAGHLTNRSVCPQVVDTGEDPISTSELCADLLNLLTTGHFSTNLFAETSSIESVCPSM